MLKKRIYLAGFDVFRPDAIAYGQYLRTLCSEHGFEGLYPLDNAAPADLRGAELAHWICRANLDLIDRADMVVANANPFRGAEPDSGTVFEMGYAHALGKPVWCYTDMAGSLIEQLDAEWHEDEQRHTDLQGYTVEDFGLNLNLMLACSTEVVQGDIAECLTRMAARYA